MQATERMQIVQMTGVATNSITPFYNPLPFHAAVAIVNNYDTNSIQISTDDTGTPSIPVPGGSYYLFRLSPNQPWRPEAFNLPNGDLLFFISGNVTIQPTIVILC